MKRKKREELMELMKIPEVEEIILAKMEQVKLIFKDEIRDIYRDKRGNIIDFPGKKKKSNLIHRHHVGENAVLIDTTSFRKLSEDEKVEIFNEYFSNDPKIREILIETFFVKLLPFTEPDIIER